MERPDVPAHLYGKAFAMPAASGLRRSMGEAITPINLPSLTAAFEASTGNCTLSIVLMTILLSGE